MNDDTFQRSLRARPPADPAYRPRFGSALAPDGVSGARAATRRALHPGVALGLLLVGLVLAGLALVVGSSPAPPVPGPAGQFAPAGEMPRFGEGFTSTLLADGRVLVVGGRFASGGIAHVTAELWDPATSSFAPTGPMSIRRWGHTATLLPDGRVLVVGGWDEPDTAEIWDPATGTFGPLISLADGRAYGAAVLLRDGRVLIVGGMGQDGAALPPAEVWDPRTGLFTSVGSPEPPRTGATATSLPDGRVLVVGGHVADGSGGSVMVTDAELWDPTTETFTPTGSMVQTRSGHVAWLLADGRVLIVGGAGTDDGPVGSAEVWDPDTGRFTRLEAPAPDGTFVLLPDGRMLVIPPAVSRSCNAGDTLTTETEIWDPFTGVTLPGGRLAEARTDPTMTLLGDGRVLVAGGQGPGRPHPTISGPGCPAQDRSVTQAEVWSPIRSSDQSTR